MVKSLTIKQTEFLRDVYYDPSNPASYGGVSKLYAASRKKKISKKQVKDWLASQDTYTLHKPIRQKFSTKRVYVSYVDEQWQGDLVDLTKLAKYNDQHKFIFTVIDILSKFAWAVPMKTKSGDDTMKALKIILKTGRKPQKLQTDQGTEFTNKKFQKLLDKQGIMFFTTKGGKKASVVERFNRTLKTKMFRYFTKNNTLRYLNVLQKLVNAYNKSFHRSIKMAPVHVNSNNESQVWNTLYKTVPKTFRFNFKAGDKVRLSKFRSPFAKGYEQGWTEELFTVVRSLPGFPPSYRVKDYNGEIIEGLVYEPEMVKVIKDDDVYIVEKIVKKSKRGNKIRYLIKWRGYPESMNSWVDAKDIQKL